MSWTVVRFIKEDTVEAIPTSWVLGNSCYWPTFTKEKVIAAIKKQEVPNTCWPMHPVSFFRNGTFDSYLDARKHCKIAEYESDLNEEKESRSIRKKKVISSSSSEDDSQKIADPPKRNSQSQSSFHGSIKGHKNDELPTNATGQIHKNVSVKPSNEGHGRNTIPPNSEETFPNYHYFQMPFTSTNDSNDRCICCPTHRIEMEQLKTLLSSLIQGHILDNVKTLIRKQNILTNMVTDVIGELHTISEGVHKMKMTEPQHESIINKFDFPIDTTEKFMEAEQFWSDESNFKASVHEFSKIGGNSIYEFIKRVMALIITNNLASKFTWFGTKEKESLIKSKLAEILLKAAEISSLDCDKKMVEEAIRKYLRRAKERSISKERHHPKQ